MTFCIHDAKSNKTVVDLSMEEGALLFPWTGAMYPGTATPLGWQHNDCTGPLRLDTTIRAEVTDKGLGTRWIKFEKVADGIKASVRVSYPSGPEAKWKLEVNLIDTQGVVLSSAEAVVDNSGIIIDVDLSFVLHEKVTRVDRFSLRVDRIFRDGS